VADLLAGATPQPTPARGTLAYSQPYLGPDSVYWRHLGVWTNLMLGPRLLVLQTAHPAVGAAVREFSTYQSDPWGRLVRTLRSLFTYVYGTRQEAANEAARLMEVHKPLKGVDDKGRRYSGLDPDARLWVHATFFEPFLTCESLFPTPLTDAERRQAYDEWRQIGGVLEIPDQDMPTTVEGFRAYWGDMIHNRLEYSGAVEDLLVGMLPALPPPARLPLPDRVWRPLIAPPAAVLRLFTIGTLPPELRERFGQSWTPRDQRRLDLAMKALRTSGRVLPPQVRYMPIAAKSMRSVRRERTRGRLRALRARV
jgi:uncharacterized protein (DUF2236 family)